MMKIASFNTKKLCQQLYHILNDPRWCLLSQWDIPPHTPFNSTETANPNDPHWELPKKIVIGRLIEGPQKWFQWKGSNKVSSDHGWEQEYYRLIECLKEKCEVEHFAVSSTYIHEVTEEVKLISATKMTKKGIMHFKNGEPIEVTPLESSQRGYMAEEKLQFWLEHWDEVKQYFHAAFYVLMGEDANDNQSFQDVLFHYHGNGLKKVAKVYGKKITRIRENFVTEQREADELVRMFHGI